MILPEGGGCVWEPTATQFTPRLADKEFVRIADGENEENRRAGNGAVSRAATASAVISGDIVILISVMDFLAGKNFAKKYITGGRYIMMTENESDVRGR